MTSSAGSAATTCAPAARAGSTSAATATPATAPAPRRRASGPANGWPQGIRAGAFRRLPPRCTATGPGRAPRPGRARGGGLCSRRMARARTRGPKLTTTVISITSDAGRNATTRRSSGRWPAASIGPRRWIRARARSVAQDDICRGGRDPASVSTSTCANWPGHAPSAGGSGPPGRRGGPSPRWCPSPSPFPAGPCPPAGSLPPGRILLPGLVLLPGPVPLACPGLGRAGGSLRRTVRGCGAGGMR